MLKFGKCAILLIQWIIINEGRRKLKKIFAFFLAVLLTVCLFTPVISAEELSAETASDCSVLYNVQTQTFLIEKNADTEIFCGFLPRLLLAVMLTESKADLEEVIEIPSGTRANTPQYSSADLKDGDKISLGDLISAMLIGNSQEAAVAVGLYMSDGNLSSIIAQMNEKAKTVGAENTVFTNVTGYNDKQNPSRTTLRDIVKICTYALSVDGILDRSDIAYTLLTVNGVTRPLYTKNSLVESSSAYYYKRATGLAVSGDSNSGFAVVSTVLNNNSRFLSVNYSKTSFSSALTDTVKLLKYSLEAYEVRELVKKNEPLTEVDVRLGKDSDFMVLYAETGIKVSLPKTAKDEDIKVTYEEIPDDIKAPINAGDAFGYAVYRYNDVEIGRTKLISRTSISVDLIAHYTDEIAGLFKNPLLWVAIVAVLALLVTYLFLVNASKRRKNKDDKIKKKRRVHGKL